MFTSLLDSLIVLTLATPLVGLTGRKINHEKPLVAAYTTLAFVFCLTQVTFYYHEVLFGNAVLVASEGHPHPEGAYLEANGLSIFMALTYLLVGAVSSAFSFQEVNRDNVTGFYTVLLGMITAMVGIVFSGDLFTLFIFWEAMCICSYTLVAFNKEKWEAIEASYKYLIMSSAGSITMLFGLSFLYGLAGTLNIKYLSMSILGAETSPMTYIALLMLIVGFGLQAGMFPFHMWLPDAHMAAPSAISAVLSGVMVKAGVYGLLKALFIVFAPLYGSWHISIAVFAVLTMFVGNLSALLQDDIKRLLAYSTVANTGYILLGIAMGSHRALTGSLFHVLNHAITKALLFFCAGAFIEGARTRSLKELAGIRRTMPVTGVAFVIGALSFATFPGLNVFWSEFTIIAAGWEAGMAWLSFLMIVNLVFSAAYALRMIQIVAILKETPRSGRAREAPLPMLIPITVLAFLSVLIGVYPGPFQTLAEAVAQAALRQT